MLPITNHKVVHVPHALAVIAALIGLVAALSWDYHVSETDAAMASKPVVVQPNSDNDELNDAKNGQSGGSSPSPPAGGAAAWDSDVVFPLFLPISQDPQ